MQICRIGRNERTIGLEGKHLVCKVAFGRWCVNGFTIRLFSTRVIFPKIRFSNATSPRVTVIFKQSVYTLGFGVSS